jgi:hypothetical protein
MGYLIFKSTYLPKFIGVLLMIGCVGYVADALVFLLYPAFGVTFSEYTFVGELVLPVWLLVKGVNVQRYADRVQDVATPPTPPLQTQQNLSAPTY